MPVNIGYYVHHHGSGHVMRAISISRALPDCTITFLGSRLEEYRNLMPENVNCIHLPMDTPEADDVNFIPLNPVDALHYAPLNVKGIRDRNRLLTEFFSSNYPLILIVDVSVEIALLARLCSVPVIVVRQHGNRNDPAHMAAYQSASALLAPYHFKMQRSEAVWLTDKTIFAGGFSRYATEDIKNIQEIDNTIAILTGRGGTSIGLKFINHLADTCRSWRVEVIGILNEDYTQLPENVVLYGHLPDPIKILRRAKIVIGNAGHNSVMEMASMNKRFIVIPEKRPFDEQIDKAELLEELGLATVVQPNQLYDTNWKRLLSDTTRSVPDWRDLIDNDAVGRAADGILSVYRSIYV